MFGEKWEEARDTHLCIFHTCSLHVLLLLLSGFASEEGADQVPCGGDPAILTCLLGACRVPHLLKRGD